MRLETHWEEWALQEREELSQAEDDSGILTTAGNSVWFSAVSLALMGVTGTTGKTGWVLKNRWQGCFEVNFLIMTMSPGCVEECSCL